MLCRIFRTLVPSMAALVAVAAIGGVAFADEPAARPAAAVLQTGHALIAQAPGSEPLMPFTEGTNVSAGSYGVNSATNVANGTETTNVSASAIFETGNVSIGQALEAGNHSLGYLR